MATKRITIRLPSGLLELAKRKAVAEDRSLTSLIIEGLELAMREDRQSKRVVPRISKATGGLMPGVDLTACRD